MRANEFLKEAEAAVQKKLGRAFNHLEDLVFFHGSRGTIEALDHIREIATIEGAQSVRMKWDGNPQIYWGREKAFGPLITLLILLPTKAEVLRLPKSKLLVTSLQNSLPAYIRCLTRQRLKTLWALSTQMDCSYKGRKSMQREFTTFALIPRVKLAIM